MSSTPERPRGALLAGASGLVGSHCLRQLLADPTYARVRALVRRPIEVTDAKLSQHLVDFDRLDAYATDVSADDVYCCLGTTMRKAGSREVFRRVDCDYPVALARLAKRQGARRFLLVSALGADPGSSVFYNRVKGEAERAVQAVGLERAWFFRPSLLKGDRAESRPAERAAILASYALNPLLVGRLSRYRSIAPATVAAAMLYVAKHGYDRAVIDSDEIARLADLERSA